jgi:hypothetical protein
MALFDFPFWAAAAMILVAPLASGKWGGKGAKLSLAAICLLLVLNLAISWHFDDPAGSVFEGQTAAFGLIGSILLFLAGCFSVAISAVASHFVTQTPAGASGE